MRSLSAVNSLLDYPGVVHVQSRPVHQVLRFLKVSSRVALVENTKRHFRGGITDAEGRDKRLHARRWC